MLGRSSFPFDLFALELLIRSVKRSNKNRKFEVFIVFFSCRRLTVRPSSVHDFKEARVPVFIKFNLNHHWVGGLIALGFGA